MPSTAAAPPCPGPDPAPRGPTRFAVPAGAIDTHAHVIGTPPAFPFVEQRSYTPPAAAEEDYLAMLDRTGMTHGVLVQVSVHGTDDRLLRRVLRAHPDRLRGIGVMPLGLPTRDYEAVRADGIVGLRLNVLYGGGIGLQSLDEYGALARDMGWHLQLLVDARELGPVASTLGRLPVPVVFDHMGHFPAALGVQEPGFQTMLQLVQDGAWVKLSGAYRLDDGPGFGSTIALAHALMQAAPDRCVWGSDWPHVAHWKPMMNVGDLLDLLADWVPDEKQRESVLVGNAQRLYGFQA
ncbi:MAG: amidohydrolase family protein [Gammaproteobacteria bacterium]|nr:amidohydrolase family protein [Gammaproteobacteria bacterium]MBU1440775.1 amidohydrolase family protein [Gammaproteobacteria bacterium]